MENKDTKKITPAPVLEEYLFAGGGEYEPITIKAASLTEATEEWERVKVAVGALSLEN